MELTNTATKLTNRFTSALVYATQLHASQVRKGSNVPYISHLLSVAALVLIVMLFLNHLGAIASCNI